MPSKEDKECTGSAYLSTNLIVPNLNKTLIRPPHNKMKPIQSRNNKINWRAARGTPTQPTVTTTVFVFNASVPNQRTTILSHLWRIRLIPIHYNSYYISIVSNLAEYAAIALSSSAARTAPSRAVLLLGSCSCCRIASTACDTFPDTRCIWN